MDTGALGPGAAYAFAGRADGVSRPPYDRGNLAEHVGDDPAAVRANRAGLAAAVGVRAEGLVALAAVHGAEVARVRAADHARQHPVDALVTTEPGCALLVMAADCVPVLLADGAAGVVGVVHAGWRGVRLDAVGALIRAMRDLGAGAGLRAIVGPAICGHCYGVDEQRYAAVVARAPAAAARTSHGGLGLDLRAAVVATLSGSGVASELLGGCTYEDRSWFSYRRDGVTGRHGGAVVLTADRRHDTGRPGSSVQGGAPTLR